MPRTIRFHLDENCSHAIAAGLRRRGIDVTTTPEVGLLGAIDERSWRSLRTSRSRCHADSDKFSRFGGRNLVDKRIFHDRDA